jgi:DNA-binding MarR family transcriptional regulator
MSMPEDPVMDALERLFIAAVGVTSVALAEAGASPDLTLQQWRALVVISASDGLRPGVVAQQIGMSRPSMSRLVRRLERRGVVLVEPDPLDGRAVVLRATPAGAALRRAVMARRRELVRQALAAHRGRLPDDLQGGLRAIAEALAWFG